MISTAGSAFSTSSLVAATGVVLVGVAIAYQYWHSTARRFSADPALKAARKQLVTAAELVMHLRGGDRKKCLTPTSAALSEWQANTKRMFHDNPHVISSLRPIVVIVADMIAAIEAAEKRRKTSFNESCAADVALLKRIWTAAFSAMVPFERTSAAWNEMGFQGLDPTTDLRGGGMFALDALAHYAEHHTTEFRAMCEFNRKQQQQGSNSWFLTAVVSIQFSSMLLEPKFDVGLGCLEELYSASEGDEHTAKGEAALYSLHASLLHMFFTKWKEDLPHVMDFTQWIDRHVYCTFFAR